jgi:hypothetical protein
MQKHFALFSVPSMQAHGGDDTTIGFLDVGVMVHLASRFVPVLQGTPVSWRSEAMEF